MVAFNDAINRADLTALSDLMTDRHRFVDPAGAVVEGRAACTGAWSTFFESFPDYRNDFDTVEDLGRGIVRASGHSRCSAEALQGPAVWTAIVEAGRVVEWRVDDPRPGSDDSFEPGPPNPGPAAPAQDRRCH